jgi:hypothetical protein
VAVGPDFMFDVLVPPNLVEGEDLTLTFYAYYEADQVPTEATITVQVFERDTDGASGVAIGTLEATPLTAVDAPVAGYSCTLTPTPGVMLTVSCQLDITPHAAGYCNINVTAIKIS